MKVVTLSTDTPEEIRTGRARHGLQVAMLSDPQLVAIDRFGLRDREAGSDAPEQALPVPATLLVDADGTVVWKDQGEDFTRRSDPEDVLRALQEQLAKAP